jgi:hypothetical protein
MKLQAVRISIDIIFTVVLLCALMYRITGDAVHEWIGVSVGIVCIAHNVLNWKWYKNIFKGAYNLRRGVMTTVNLLLVFVMVTLIITGALHSRTVLTFSHLPGGMMIRLIHTTAAYWCLPLIGVHIGLNWGIILNAFRKMVKINGENRARKILLCVIALTIVAFGVWSSFDRDMFSKLFLGFSFDYWPEERPAILFFTANLSIMGVYIYATYHVLKFIDLFHHRKTQIKNEGTI